MPIGNPVAHYPFEGNANDMTGNGHDGLVRGTPTFGSGIEGDAIQFNGIDSFVEVPDGLNFVNEFTVSMWYKREVSQSLYLMKGEYCPSENPDYKGLAYIVSVSAGGFDAEIGAYQVVTNEAYEPDGDYFRDRIRTSGFSSSSLPENFVSIVVVFKQNLMGISEFTAYLNGEQLFTGNEYLCCDGAAGVPINPENFSPPLHQTPSSLKIGAYEAYCAGLDHFGGFSDATIDELKFYDYALSDEEIRAIASEFTASPTTQETLVKTAEATFLETGTETVAATSLETMGATLSKTHVETVAMTSPETLIETAYPTDAGTVAASVGETMTPCYASQCCTGSQPGDSISVLENQIQVLEGSLATLSGGNQPPCDADQCCTGSQLADSMGVLESQIQILENSLTSLPVGSGSQLRLLSVASDSVSSTDVADASSYAAVVAENAMLKAKLANQDRQLRGLSQGLFKPASQAQEKPNAPEPAAQIAMG